MINIPQGFNIGSIEPVDSRITLTKAEMVAMNDNVMPDVYFAACEDDGRLYVYKKSNGITAETGKFIVANDLVNDVTVNGVSVLERDINDLKVAEIIMPTKVSELENDSNYDVVEDVDAKDEAAKEEVKQYADNKFSLITEAGNKIDLELDSETYQLCSKLYNKEGELISVSSIIDLPIEELIVHIEYDAATKELVITLKSGQVLRIPLSDIISGLATEAYVDNKCAELDEAKVDKVEGKQLSTNDFTDELKNKVDEVSPGATKVDQSAVNGNIVIDGDEKLVYKLPRSSSTELGGIKIDNQSLRWVGDVVVATAAVADVKWNDIQTKPFETLNNEHFEVVDGQLNVIGGVGPGGTTDYNELDNKPKINNVELQGNKSLDALNIQHKLTAGQNILIENNTISATVTGGTVTEDILVGKAIGDYQAGDIIYAGTSLTDIVKKLVCAEVPPTIDYLYYGPKTNRLPDVTGLNRSEGSAERSVLEAGFRFSFAGRSVYPTIAYPASFGDLTSIMDDDGDDNLSIFEKMTTVINGTNYFMYISNVSMTKGGEGLPLTFKI